LSGHRLYVVVRDFVVFIQAGASLLSTVVFHTEAIGIIAGILHTGIWYFTEPPSVLHSSTVRAATEQTVLVAHTRTAVLTFVHATILRQLPLAMFSNESSFALTAVRIITLLIVLRVRRLALTNVLADWTQCCVAFRWTVADSAVQSDLPNARHVVLRRTQKRQRVAKYLSEAVR